jgi:hypothetical protein
MPIDSRRNAMRAKARYVLCAAVTLGACAQIPTGPSVAVMPPPGKPFEVFAADDQACRSYASQSSGGESAQQASTDSLLGSAVVGTALGAAAGALVGGGRGAGAGAAVGAVAGTAIGAHEANRAGETVQHRYDIAYQQCMYAHGDLLRGQSAAAYVPPPPPPPPTL